MSERGRYVSEPCNCVALAARVPLPLDRLYVPYYDVGDLAALFRREPALRDPFAYENENAPERTSFNSFLAKASTVDRRPYAERTDLARKCATSRQAVRDAALRFSAHRRRCGAGAPADPGLLNDLLSAQSAFLSLRQRLRNAGGYARLRSERGERAALRALGLLDEREARFRLRRRLCWIGAGDPASPLCRLCPSLIDLIVPYFDYEAHSPLRSGPPDTPPPPPPREGASSSS